MQVSDISYFFINRYCSVSKVWFQDRGPQRVVAPSTGSHANTPFKDKGTKNGIHKPANPTFSLSDTHPLAFRNLLGSLYGFSSLRHRAGRPKCGFQVIAAAKKKKQQKGDLKIHGGQHRRNKKPGSASFSQSAFGEPRRMLSRRVQKDVSANCEEIVQAAFIGFPLIQLVSAEIVSPVIQMSWNVGHC